MTSELMLVRRSFRDLKAAKENLMASPRWALAFMLLASVALGACTGSMPLAATPTVVPPTVAVAPTVTAVAPTEVPPMPTASSRPSFEATTYRDEVAGFEFDYPQGWYVGPVEHQSRGGITAFTSWERPTDVFPDTLPAGETRLDVVVQLWDPKGDLDAFVQQRMLAWESSGSPAVSQGEWALADGRMAKSFIITGADGTKSYVFLTTLGDKYLTISGLGDLALVAEIAHTVRPITVGN